MQATYPLAFALVAILLPHSAIPISFDYPDFDAQNTITGHCPRDVPRICLHGNATLHSSAIFLTQEHKYPSGMAYYSEPVRLWDDSTGKLLLTNFTTNFSFLITRTEPINSGDGLAFFLSYYPPRTRSTPEVLVAVVIDAFVANSRDGPVPHVSIDVNSVKSVESQTMEEYNSTTVITCKARVEYDSSNKELSVSLTCDPNREYSLSHLVDLVSLIFAKDQFVAIGFSGNTGRSLTQTNQVSSWSFESTLDATLEESTRNGNRRKALVSIAAALALQSTLGITIFLLWRMAKSQTKEKKGTEQEDAPSSSAEKRIHPSNPHAFPLHRLVEATRNFDDGRKLGCVGRSSDTFYFRDLDGHVAIKRVLVSNREEVSKEYIAQVEMMSELRHSHLVPLLGWCHEKHDLFLVYQLILPHLRLDVHLFANDRSLPWNLRYDISLQMASALLHLHEDCTECIVHGDVQAKNIMLDDSFNAKVGDFVLGLAKRGTQSDVYAFGIVALEIATGTRDKEGEEEEANKCLVKWEGGLFERGELLQAADLKLGDNFETSQMERLLIVGLWCIDPDLHGRPSIWRAMSALNFEDVRIDLPLTNFSSTPSSPASPSSNRTNISHHSAETSITVDELD